MPQRNPRLAEVRDPQGRAVVLLARIWEGKVLHDHPELAGHLDLVLETVARPDVVEPDRRPDRLRYYRRSEGPSRWLLVVVSFEQDAGRIISAFAVRKDPTSWKP